MNDQGVDFIDSGDNEQARRQRRRSRRDYIQLSQLLPEIERHSHQALFRSRMLDALEAKIIRGFELHEEIKIQSGSKSHTVQDICLYSTPETLHWIEETRKSMNQGSSRYYRPSMRMVLSGQVDFDLAENNTIEAISRRRRGRETARPQIPSPTKEELIIAREASMAGGISPLMPKAPESEAKLREQIEEQAGAPEETQQQAIEDKQAGAEEEALATQDQFNPEELIPAGLEVPELAVKAGVEEDAQPSDPATAGNTSTDPGETEQRDEQQPEEGGQPDGLDNAEDLLGFDSPPPLEPTGLSGLMRRRRNT